VKFGYGIYEFEVRASSTAESPSAAGQAVSGSCTGCFNYGPKSITEIDVEFEGGERRNLTHCTTWNGEANANESTQVQPTSSKTLPFQIFHKYAFVWSPGKIEFYRNGALIATHTKVVPTEAAPMMFNHWGTHNKNWGGLATPNVDRYVYIKSFKFVPL
jgi:beta-glucanase (GH16 family)